MKLVFCFICSVGFKCPVTFNPADHYINTLAVFPGNEIHSRYRIKRICDSYAISDYCRDIDITIQFQSNLNVCYIWNVVKLRNWANK